MYHFSRAIYRELAPYVLEQKPTCQRESNRERVLHACEMAIQRLVSDRRYFARPAHSLFENVRVYFPIWCQLRTYMVIERRIDMVQRAIDRLPDEALEAAGVERRCDALTRKGTPCQRQPLPRSEYCPSHQHLVERFEEFKGFEQLEELEEVSLAA